MPNDQEQATGSDAKKVTAEDLINEAKKDTKDEKSLTEKTATGEVVVDAEQAPQGVRDGKD